MIRRNGLVYFASMNGQVIVTDAGGEFRERIDLMTIVEAEQRQKEGAEIFGLTVDADGNIFFTIPVLFKVYKYSREGKHDFFGQSGSAPGKFGVVAGVAVDSQGNILVSDKQKSAVILFDKNFAFVTEFGYRGTRPENLFVPDDIVVDGRDRLYVTQGRKRGVSVFALTTK
jgi:sugar lactone lactonase YvrE